MTKPKRQSSKKPAKRAAPKKPKKKPSLFARLGSLGRHYALAGLAGVAVILAGGAATLWAGGYVGVLAEQANRAASEGAVAAGFEIRRVTLQGREETASDDLDGAIGPVLGQSILHFSPDAARARIEELGWVRAA